MASRIAEAYVQITPRIDGIASKLNSQLSGQMSAAGGVGGNALAEGVGSGFGNKVSVALKVGFAAATVAIGAFAKSSITAASDFEESANAVRVAYGSAAADVAKLSTDAATRLGVSSTDFNNAAVRFSAFAERIAGSEGDVAGVVGSLTERASDFASVFNIDVSEALSVFSSGLAGEAEPLKRFGINLLDTEVKAYAVRAGIVAQGQALTETQKVQARYGLLLESTAKTQGDFANTSDGLANSQRILSANFEELKITAGTSLAPAFAVLVTAITPLIQQAGPVLAQLFESLVPLFAAVASFLPTLSTLFMGLIPIVELLFDAFTSVVEAALPFLIELFNMLLPILDALLPPIIEIVEALLPMIPAILEIVQAFLPLVMLILPLLIGLIKFLTPVLVIVAQVIAGVVGGAVSFLVGILGGLLVILTPVFDVFKAVFYGIANIVIFVANIIIGGVEFMVNSIIDGLNLVIGALNKLKFKAPDWVPLIGGQSFGFKIDKIAGAKIGRIPALADGGFVDQPTTALIGEAGPEVVMPLNRFEQLMGIGSKPGQTINYYAAPNQSLDAEQALLQAVKRARVITGW
jgi:phage-related protein